MRMGPGWISAIVVGVFRAISGVKVLATTSGDDWWCPLVSIGSLFGDIMILSSLDIWVFPERYIDCSTGFIGPAFGRNYDRIWLAVRSVWPVSLLAAAGPYGAFLSGSPMESGGHGYS